MRFPLAICALAGLYGCVAPGSYAPPQQPAPRVLLPAPNEEANDTALFGLVLNKPFGGILECPGGADYVHPGRFRYDSYADVTCYQRSPAVAGTDSPLGTESISVHWPYNKSPTMVRRQTAEVLLLDGVVHSVAFTTYGLSRQEKDLSELAAKFGKPDLQKAGSQQNRMGAKYEVLTAGWSRPGDVTIAFTGALGRIDEGRVDASTARGTDYFRQKSEERNKDRQPL